MRQALLSRRHVIASLGSCVAAGACGASPPPRRFLLAPRPAAAPRPSTQHIMVAGVAVARYLDQPQIARRAVGYELSLAENERWGEGTADMVARVLAEDLEARLPGSQVFIGDGVAAAPPDASVELYIDRFDPDPDGTVILAARWLVRRGAAAHLGAERISERPVSPATGDLVAAMSDALARLADRLAATLSG